MTNREFRKLWGTANMRTALNRAIRADVPDGGAVLDRLTARHHAALAAGRQPDDDPGYRAALDLSRQHEAEVRRKYGLPPLED